MPAMRPLNCVARLAGLALGCYCWSSSPRAAAQAAPGRLLGWGHFSPTGVLSDEDRALPNRIGGPNSSVWSGAALLAGGGGHAVAAAACCNLTAFGSDVYGQLGSAATTGDRLAAAPAAGSAASAVGVGALGGGVAALAAGRGHTLALTEDGTLWGWGRDLEGQLGRGEGAAAAVVASPVVLVGPADGLGELSAIGAGWYKSAAIGGGTVLE